MLNLKCAPVGRAIGSIALQNGALLAATPAVAANVETKNPRRSVVCNKARPAFMKFPVECRQYGTFGETRYQWAMRDSKVWQIHREKRKGRPKAAQNPAHLGTVLILGCGKWRRPGPRCLRIPGRRSWASSGRRPARPLAQREANGKIESLGWRLATA
jgi:hypothetical protein